MRYSLATTLALTLLLGAGNLMAAAVSEIEGSSQVLNNRFNTAQTISASAFTLPVPAGVFNPPGWATATIQGQGGGNDVDFYSFTTGAGSALFDIDGTASGFDSLLSLFNSAGTLIAQDDDSSPADLGSAAASDSFLGTIVLSTGTYYIGVSTYQNFPTGAALYPDQKFVRPDGNSTGGIVATSTGGDTYWYGNTSAGTGKAYTLNISLSAVPEPGMLALVISGMLGLLAYAWRQGARRCAAGS
jgi:hypothetical protein